ncbi:hypothetical protein B4U80_05355 [Leptotrombidium deliense]|uniref:Uncharacterized protein n=1 Tax=Leptotrombidium deliense TaxID=299467 RepID=A0A443SBE8_9ACAR|nr:hypothetical protein B4U80_05355 [Leptotrombidium deliense]
MRRFIQLVGNACVYRFTNENGCVVIVLLFGKLAEASKTFHVFWCATWRLRISLWTHQHWVNKVHAITWQTSKGCQHAGFPGVLSS